MLEVEHNLDDALVYNRNRGRQWQERMPNTTVSTTTGNQKHQRMVKVQVEPQSHTWNRWIRTSWSCKFHLQHTGSPSPGYQGASRPRAEGASSATDAGASPVVCAVGRARALWIPTSTQATVTDSDVQWFGMQMVYITTSADNLMRSYSWSRSREVATSNTGIQ